MPRTISFGGISSVNVSSFTVPTNPQTLLVVEVVGSRGVPVPPPAPITDLSFGGVAMTLAGQFNAYQTGANETVPQVWYLYNPPMGSSQNFTSVSGGGSQSVNYAAYYLNAVSLFSSFQSAGGQQGGSPGSTSLFMNNNFQTNAWALTTGVGSSISVTSPTFSPATRAAGTTFFWSDTGATFSGIYEFDYSLLANSLYGVMGFFIIPYSDPVVTDTVTVTDSVHIQLNPLHINVSDSTAITESVSIDNNATPSDILASLVSSSYKWLTATLLAAQQAFAVRPYYTCKIIDDTIQPNAQLFNGTGNPLGRGSMANGPDGSIMAAGFDSNGYIAFWKATDLNAAAGVWPTKVVLDMSATLGQAMNQVSMSVSGWFKGSYQIDIWYFGNFGNDATNIKIFNQYSTDGGVTWTMRTFTPASMPNTNYPADNISIAAMQDINIGNQIWSGCFYIKPNGNTFDSGFTGYDVYYIWGNFGGFSTDVEWAANNANSSDWTIHSIAAFYLKGVQYLVFSGFHNILGSTGSNENFSIWVTQLLNIQDNVGSDLWTPPVAVMPIASTSNLNQNAFTNPSASVQNGMAYIVMQATLVDSITQTAQGETSNVVTTNTSYMMIQSDDGKTFSYPSVMVYTDGTQFNSGLVASFIPQAGYWYLGGSNGYLWQYVQNNIVADVSADIIGYQISEQAGQPSTISIQIANANNKWVGASPTGPGAAAIARNRKIAVWQGYYNSSGIPEAVPRNVYFIDDVQNQVSGTQNDVTLVGRDIYKNMIVTVTKFNYQFIGPVYYTDIFDGTTNGNWNQIAGTWTFSPTQNAVLGLNAGQEATMMLANVQNNTFGHSMRVFSLDTQEGTAYFYAMYVDANNWFRLEIDTFHNTWAAVQNVGGSKSTLNSGSVSLTNLDNYMIIVKRYGYWNFNFLFAPAGGTGNELSVYSPSTPSVMLGTGGYALGATVAANPSMQGPFSVGVGASASVTQEFKYFQLAVYNNSNNIGEVTRAFARLTSIFTFKIVNTFRELFFTTTQFNGTFTLHNRVLQVEASNEAISSINSMGDGEIDFQAKVALVTSATPGGFRFIFRSDSATTPANAYAFHLLWNGLTGTSSGVTCRFERLLGGVWYVFYNSAEDVQTGTEFTNTSTLNIDPTLFHRFRVLAINGQLTAFVDDVMVAAWNDDNTTNQYLKSGYWGFSPDSNTNMSAQEITAPILWKPVPATSINPGDEVESDITALAQQLLFWFFSDMFGRFKTIFLQSTDSSTYTYDGQLYQQNVDQSDKEYVSQVTVNGTGVYATARNTTLMAGTPTRDLVIVNNTILTQTDAQTLANNTLINSNQYLNQNESTQVINVGAELFDVVTVVNTGNNTSGVSGSTRVYDQTFSAGGGNNQPDYSVTIDTGNV